MYQYNILHLEIQGHSAAAKVENPASSPKLTNTPAVAAPEPSVTPKPTESPDTVGTPEPSMEVVPTEAPKTTESPNPTETPKPSVTPAPATQTNAVAGSDLIANIDWIVKNLGLARTSDKTAMYNPRNNAISGALFSVGYNPRFEFAD